MILLYACLALSVTACSQNNNTQESSAQQSQSAPDSNLESSEQKPNDESTIIPNNGELLEEDSIIENMPLLSEMSTEYQAIY